MAGRIKALSLYKSLLRAHVKYLPEEMRQLGDAYIKSEFRLHKSVTKTDQLENFFAEWNGYLAHIEKTGREKQSLSVGLVDSPSVGNGGNANNKIKSPSAGFGRDMPKGVAFNEEQESQLRKLREEATKAKRS